MSCTISVLYIPDVAYTPSVHTDVSCTVSVHTECVLYNICTRQVTIICRDLTIEHLKRFEHVRVIRGVLSLQGWDSSRPPLDFFRNVEYIGSEYFSLTTISTPGSQTALVVANNGDTCRIDLSNLRQIRAGNVGFAFNNGLCYLGDFQTNLTSVYLAVQGEQSLKTGPDDPFKNLVSCVL